MRQHRTGITALLAAALVAALLPEVVAAAWSVGGTGAARGAAAVMPAAATPSARASVDVVTVVWTAATFPDGTAVAGYVVHRYDALSGVSVPVGGTCAGIVTTASCGETVTSGAWVYTDTPVQLTWLGAESSPSNAVTTP